MSSDTSVQISMRIPSDLVAWMDEVLGQSNCPFRTRVDFLWYLLKTERNRGPTWTLPAPQPESVEPFMLDAPDSLVAEDEDEDEAGAFYAGPYSRGMRGGVLGGEVLGIPGPCSLREQMQARLRPGAGPIDFHRFNPGAILSFFPLFVDHPATLSLRERAQGVTGSAEEMAKARIAANQKLFPGATSEIVLLPKQSSLLYTSPFDVAHREASIFGIYGIATKGDLSFVELQDVQVGGGCNLLPVENWYKVEYLQERGFFDPSNGASKLRDNPILKWPNSAQCQIRNTGPEPVILRLYLVMQS